MKILKRNLIVGLSRTKRLLYAQQNGRYLPICVRTKSGPFFPCTWSLGGHWCQVKIGPRKPVKWPGRPQLLIYHDFWPLSPICLDPFFTGIQALVRCLGRVISLSVLNDCLIRTKYFLFRTNYFLFRTNLLSPSFSKNSCSCCSWGINHNCTLM